MSIAPNTQITTNKIIITGAKNIQDIGQQLIHHVAFLRRT